MAEPNSVSVLDAPADASAKFQGIQPIGSVGTLKGLLEKNMANLAAVLPKHVTADRLLKTLYVAVNRNPDILACAQSSIIEAIQRAGELGLDLSGTMGEAYIVPYYQKIKWTGPGGTKQEKKMMVAVMQPGYQGLAKLARQSGEVALLDSDAVYEKDEFVFQKGSEFKCIFKPYLLGDRGKILGCYAYFKLADGSETAEWMDWNTIDKVRQRSNSADSPAWRDYPDQMGRKVVFKRGVKWIPRSAEKPAMRKLLDAIEQDNAVDFDALAAEVDINARSGAVAVADILQKEQAGVPEKTAVTALSPDHIDMLALAVKAAGLSFDAYQERIGGPLQEITSAPGQTEEAFYEELRAAIGAMAAENKAAGESQGPLFSGGKGKK